MIVDDNWFAISLLRTVLQALGMWRLTECSSSADALKRLEQERFDLVLVDNNMPIMTGVELTRMIRGSAKVDNPALPIIMISGKTELGQVNDAVNAGVNEFLAKPFSADGVMRKILTAVNQPRPFIRAKTYIGPCRRRQRLPLKKHGVERRAAVAAGIVA